MNERYELLSGRKSYGRFRSLKPAVQAAVAICCHSWLDIGIWSRSELIVVVQPGGEIVELLPSTVEPAPAASCPTPDAA